MMLVSTEIRDLVRTSNESCLAAFVMTHEAEVLKKNAELENVYDDVHTPEWKSNLLNNIRGETWMQAMAAWACKYGREDFQPEFKESCHRISLQKRRMYPKVANTYDLIKKTTKSTFWQKAEKLERLREIHKMGRILIESHVHTSFSVYTDELREELKKLIRFFFNSMAKLQVFFASKDTQFSPVCFRVLRSSFLEFRFGDGVPEQYYASWACVKSFNMCHDDDDDDDDDVLARDFAATFQHDVKKIQWCVQGGHQNSKEFKALKLMKRKIKGGAF